MDNSNSEEIAAQKEYLRKCLKLTPTQRIKKMFEMVKLAHSAKKISK